MSNAHSHRSDQEDLEIKYDGTDWREVPEEVFSAMFEAITKSVQDHLLWNQAAYGKAWTGEGEDSEFICSEAPDAVIAALREAGFEVVRTRV